MIIGVDKLKAEMDRVRNDPKYLPEEWGTGKITKCNLATFQLLQNLGLALFWKHPEERVMLANEMVEFMDSHPALFSRFKDHTAAWEIANTGALVLAAQKGLEHGHICAVYPSAGMETSGKWSAAVPLANNIGTKNTVQGINYCFAEPPLYYMVI